MHKIIPAKHFVQMLAANMNNTKLSDEAFREMVQNTLQFVEGGDITVKDNIRRVEFVQSPSLVDAGATKSK